MTQPAINLEEIRQKLYERLKPSGWGDKLKTFLLSEDFLKILTELYSQSTNGKRFTPGLKQLFRAFEECPYNELSVVIVGQDPYPMVGEADGIAFSCSNTRKAATSLRYIFGEIESTVYKPHIPSEELSVLAKGFDPDLKRWSNQGVLMLNTALTTNVGKIGTHYELWKPFMNFLFDMLSNNNTGIVYAFLGTKAKEWASSVGDNNHKLFSTHPAYAAYCKSKTWESDELFVKISDTVLGLTGSQLVW